MFAFVTSDTSDDDDEGVVAVLSPVSNTWFPLVGTDMARIDSMKEAARQTATAIGKPVRLLKFSAQEELEIFEPLENPI